MKIDQLVYFLEAAHHNHIRKAAKALAISPSAISHSISSLEEELGFKLFEKTGKRLSLTEEGRILTERARRALREIHDLKSDLSSGTAALEGLYRVAGTHWFVSSILAPHCSSLQKKFPKVHFEIQSLRSAEIVAKVAEGQLEFGLCLNPLFHPQVESLELARGPCYFAVRKGHPSLSLSPARRWKSLADYPFASTREVHGVEGCGIIEMLLEKQITVTPSFFYDSYDVALSWVLSSEGWCLLPQIVIAANAPRIIAAFPRVPQSQVKITGLWSKARALPRPIQLLLQELASHYKENSH